MLDTGGRDNTFIDFSCPCIPHPASRILSFHIHIVTQEIVQFLASLHQVQ